ncbi:hypothetical protein [Microvirga sp. Mcv34]|uniref:hypothetical protein n=1 Tax=Microvirga sp. Mcv34 TaxID=2926016 RepID=UPI0021C83327|nr:hypothetical protein [Microvirga sp. Mcv34]
MPWSDYHRRSEAIASQAFIAKAAGDHQQASHLYEEAAKAEQSALFEVDSGKHRTFGITAVSAVSLWYKSGKFDEAERLAYYALNDSRLPSFALKELRLLVQAIWTEGSKREANLTFLPGQITVSIKGGQVVTGGAPLDLIVEKTQTIQAIFYRSMEYEQKLPFRLKGGPPKNIIDSCRPWLFQAPPGSYQFSIAIQNDPQADMFVSAPNPAALATRFLAIIKASAEDGQLENIIGDDDYRSTFLKLTRNLAPTGKSFSSIEFRSEDALLQPVVLTPESRSAINRAISPPRSSKAASPNKGQELTEHGILRALHLNQDWLEVVRDDGQSVHISGLQETVDDVIGPMVNKRVVVRATKGKRSQLKFVDIELDE